MKKQMIKGVLVACMLLIGFIVQAQTSSNPVGKWDFNVPEAPYEYSTGKAEFKMQDGKLMLSLTITGQQSSPAYEVKKNDKTYVCEMAFDNFYMKITLNPDGDNLKGLISSDQWDVGITMTPEKK
jgi:uncharacterized protein (DUF2147 family)